MSEPEATREQKAEGEQEEKRESLAERLSHVKKAWGLLGIALAILTLGLGGYIQQLIQPYFTVWQIIWATLPLTAAVAIICFMLLRGHELSGGAIFSIIIGTFLASAVTGLTGGTRVFDYLYGAPFQCSAGSESAFPQLCHQYSSTAPNENMVLSILSGYVHVYGLIGFARSVLVGSFLGYGVCTVAGRGAGMKTAHQQHRESRPAA